MIKDEIIVNKENYINLLEKFDDKYSKVKYYVSVKTLKLNEGIIGFFFDTIEHVYHSEESCLRLYGLLQAMFVSIDSLYSLSESITNSKNFVRINDNKTLRELKYIRNDVVGHPTNRIVENNIVYCTLDPKDILKYSFKYQVFIDSNKENEREVSFLDMLNDYYTEACKLLNNLYNYKEIISTNILSDDIYFLINEYQSNKLIKTDLKEIENKLKLIYQNSDMRIFKKFNLLKKIDKLEKTELNKFCYLYHLIKLYRDLSNLEKQSPLKITLKNMPKEIKDIKKLFSNEKYKSLLEILKNHNYPTYKEALNKIILISKKENNKGSIIFFEEIRKRLESNMLDEAYALEAMLNLV